MKEYLDKLEKKIVSEIEVEEIEIIDNSHLHKKHKFFDKRKCHILLKIKSKYLKSFKKIDSHKKIMKVLNEDLKEKIHALEIQIR
tara:strand:- start:320 stop:574 length:255 start_codon:yes stop_codon:yes gene_type:complete